jgi:hypothetical protein
MRQAVATWAARDESDLLIREVATLRTLAASLDQKGWVAWANPAGDAPSNSLGHNNAPDGLATLAAVVNWRLRRGIEVQVHCEPGPSRAFALDLTPDCLLRAMWLQFAQWLSTGAEYRPCEVCGEWFLVSRTEGGRRKRRDYCGNACKLWAWRHHDNLQRGGEGADVQAVPRQRRRRSRTH